MMLNTFITFSKKGSIQTDNYTEAEPSYPHHFCILVARLGFLERSDLLETHWYRSDVKCDLALSKLISLPSPIPSSPKNSSQNL